MMISIRYNDLNIALLLNDSLLNLKALIFIL